MTVFERVCLLMSDQGCGVFSVQNINETCLLFEIGFDSLRYMELVVLLEETFNISFPDEMLDISSETSVEQIVNTVQECLVDKGD